MSKYCENCGCRKVSGYCTNCQEEAFIAFVQAPEMDFSDEFMKKAWEQENNKNNQGGCNYE